MDDQDEILSIFIEEAKELLEAWESTMLRIEKTSDPKDLDALFRAAHNLKGSSRTVGLKNFGDLVHLAENVIDAVRKKEVILTPHHVAVLLESQNFLMNWTEKLTSNADYKPNYDKLSEKLKSCCEKNDDQDPFVKKINKEGFMVFDDNIEEKNHQIEEINAGEKKEVTKNQADFIRVASDKLEKIGSSVEDLMTHLNLLIHKAKSSGSHDFIEDLSGLFLKLGNLHEETIQLRCQTVASLFQRLERTIRDVAKMQNKKVEVFFEGENVEIDRLIIEALKDPLIHVARNAVDHGIEKENDRLKSGKNSSASIWIKLKKQGSSAIFEIIDDGKGLNSDIIFKKALDLGLVSIKDKLSKDEIINLIFRPGFSTAEKITDISGRGVGMDVVLQQIKKLKGEIKIESELGSGSKIKMIIPSNINITEAIVAQMRTYTVCIPIDQINEIISLEDYDLKKIDRQIYINYNNKSVPIYFLCEALGAKKQSISDERIKQLKCIIVSNNDIKSYFGFIVREIKNLSYIVIRPQKGKLEDVAFISGMTILENGKPSFVINMNKIVDTISNDQTARQVH